MLNGIEAIIFDMDGSLVDSMWLWYDIDVEYLGERGIELPDTYQKEIEGMSFTETAVYSIERFGLQESVEELKALWNKMAEYKYAHEVDYKPGAEKFLKYCVQHGIKLGIATSNSKELVAAVSEALHFEKYISQIVTSCEVAKGKPAPDVYLEAAKRLGVAPERCLVFEDIVPGIMAGKNAGMKVCAVEDEASLEYTEEKKAAADYYIADYEQVLNNTYEIV